MAIFLDEPFPDEALFSTIARYLTDARVTRRGTFLKAPAYSDATLLIGIAAGLERMAAETSIVWGLSAVEIRDRLTLYPYYAALCANGTDQSAGNAVHWRRSNGATLGRLGLRHCEMCWMGDVENGIPRYWRRTHQLPGVLTCLEHRSPLNSSGCGASRSLLETGRRFDAGRRIDPAGSDAQRAARARFAALCARVLRDGRRCCRYLDKSVRTGCVRSLGYMAGDCADFKRMAADLVDMLGVAYFGETGIPLHSDHWIRRTSLRTECTPGSALRYMLVEFLLQDRTDLMTTVQAPVCVRATSASDPQHRLAIRELGRYETHCVCSCGLSFLYTRDPVSGARMRRPTHDGLDLSLAAAQLLGRGYPIGRVGQRLGIATKQLESMLKNHVEVSSWRCQRERARHLAAWVELVDRCGDVDMALANDRGHWRVLAALQRSLPDHLVPASGIFQKVAEHGDLS